MAYTPPAGNAVAIAFAGLYTPPLGNAVAIPFGDTIPVPQASADSYATTLGSSLVVDAPGVLGSDVVNGAALSVIATTTHGDLALSSDGSFVYTPEPGYVGSDSFSYELVNTWGVSSATVTLSVDALPVERKPMASILTARIAPGVAVTPPPPPARVGSRDYYLWKVAVTGRNGPYRVALSGTLPDGLAWDGPTLTVYGSPTEAGRFPVTITVTGADRVPVTFPFVIPVEAVPIQLIGALDAGDVGDPVTGALTVVGGTAAYVLLGVDATPPPGITFSMASGVITASGLATIAGTFHWNFLIRDAAGTFARIGYSLGVGESTGIFHYVTSSGDHYVTASADHYVTHAMPIGDETHTED